MSVIFPYFFLNMTNPVTDTSSSRMKQMIGPMTILTTYSGSPVQHIHSHSQSFFRGEKGKAMFNLTDKILLLKMLNIFMQHIK